MRAEDRAFLDDFVSFVCLNHPVVALALHQAAVDAEDVATRAYAMTYRLDAGRAADISKSRNIAALVQTYVVARLMAQRAAAIEDCGAMGDAVRHRDRDGLLRRYLRSEGGQVAEFFDAVLRGEPVPALLRLPTLATMRASGDERELLIQSYAGVTSAVEQVARIYRAEGSALNASPALGSDEATDLVSIVTDIIPAGQSAKKGKGSLLAAYNKVKHRFMVPQDLERLGRAVGESGDRLVGVTHPRDPGHGRGLVDQVITVASTTGEMGALMLKLDDLGAI